MGYKYYNANPFKNTSSDCTIRAISALTGDSWDDIYIDLSLQGFLMKDMMSANNVWGDYLYQRGYDKFVCRHKGYCPTIREFSLSHPYGKFLACTGSHVVPVINGNYYDTWDSGDEIVDYYWRKESY